MNNLRSIALCVLALATSLFACTPEPRVIPATQAIVTIGAALQTKLTSLEAQVFDAAGTKRGDHFTFDLTAHPLPFSFTVVPSLPTTTSALVVLSGKDAQDVERVRTKAIVQFIAQKTMGMQMWLLEACVDATCTDGETCSADTPSGGCGGVPSLTGSEIEAGSELDAASTIAVETATTADVSRPSTTADASTSPTLAADAGPDGATMQALPSDPLDAGPTATSSACVGSPSAAVCTDTILHVCNAAGEVEKRETCPSARQCQLGKAAKACAPCEPGSYRCTATRLDRCATDGSKWELAQTCESAALCNMKAGDCTAGVCTATTRTCMTNDLYGCSQDLSRLERIASCDAGLCDSVVGECDKCNAGASTCNNGYAEVCDGRGQNLTRTLCTGALPKCSGGQCVQCTLPSDCAAPTNTCMTATCVASTARCATANKAAHQACAGGVCNGSGACVGCVDDTDCRTSGAGKCLNTRCVQCKANADCGAGFECTASNTCQRVSIAGTGTSCLSTAPASGGMCGSWFCGVSTTRFAQAFDPSSVCGPDVSFMCQGTLEKIALTCSSASAIASDPDGDTMRCLRADTTVQSHGTTDACLKCFADSQRCCRVSLDCLASCATTGAGTTCDAARKNAGCVNPLFTCTGLPNPL